jgi:uncharacterized protein DUF177 involved in 23S rRNA accumulation
MTQPGGDAKAPWSVPVRIDDVPATGLRIELAADERAREAIAALAGLRAVARLEAVFDVARRGRHGLWVTGNVSATVEQSCVVTLDPIVNVVEEAVGIAFGPAGADIESLKDVVLALDMPAEDAPEPLVDGRVDLGAVAIEFLLLGLDPYPRKSDVTFAAPPVGETSSGPFSALSGLKAGRKPDSGN